MIFSLIWYKFDQVLFNENVAYFFLKTAFSSIFQLGGGGISRNMHPRFMLNIGLEKSLPLPLNAHATQGWI